MREALMDNLTADDADAIGVGELIAIMGEVYLVVLAILILLAACAEAMDASRGIVPIDDPAIAAAFTA
jgi:hypothetical protein